MVAERQIKGRVPPRCRDGARKGAALLRFVILKNTLAAMVVALPAQAGTTLGFDVLASPQDGGPRRWQVTGGAVDLFDAPSTRSARSETVQDGAVLSNFGCIEANSVIWCDVAPLPGGARGFVLRDRLLPAAGPDGRVPTGPDDSMERAKNGDFDDRTEVPCAQIEGQALQVCSARIARSGGGDATIVATFSNGFARSLYFTHGYFIRANATMSGVGTDTDWHLLDGLYRIRVDDQRFDVPEDFVLGD